MIVAIAVVVGGWLSLGAMIALLLGGSIALRERRDRPSAARVAGLSDGRGVLAGLVRQ
jgi:hypothetical protein